MSGIEILEKLREGNSQLAKMTITDFLDKGIPVEAAITSVGSSVSAETYVQQNQQELTPMEQALAEYRAGEKPNSVVDLMTKVNGLQGIKESPSGHNLS
jgi:hypothetical protein